LVETGGGGQVFKDLRTVEPPHDAVAAIIRDGFSVVKVAAE
jgi:hypothetical protein